MNYEDYKHLIGKEVMMKIDAEGQWVRGVLKYNWEYDCFLNTEGWVVMEAQE
ncbi:MAG: hypothetical protein GY941_29010 [Planctomycetes bacterium]|nr:hypothetical protein [Planctomycetota bacterium]